jgi:hypothetical protein
MLDSCAENDEQGVQAGRQNDVGRAQTQSRQGFRPRAGVSEASDMSLSSQYCAQVPIPSPKADEVLLKVLACSLCGTDSHVCDWDPPFSAGKPRTDRCFLANALNLVLCPRTQADSHRQSPPATRSAVKVGAAALQRAQ